MTLPKENLDTKTYEDLAKEAVSRIPVYAPEWTDHNVHDPGRTFIELFAWLAEMQIYSLNRITDRSRRKFLKLMGIPELRPAKAATVDVTFSLLSGTPTSIKKGTIVAASDPVSGEDVLFETQQDLMVIKSELTKILVRPMLFSWDNIPGNDDERLIRYLKTRYGIEWAETAKIEKIDDFNVGVFAWYFSWDDIPGNDDARLREFLKQNFDIDWIKTANIEKIDNGKTIKISYQKNSYKKKWLSLKLNDEQTEVNLEIDDRRTDKISVKIENSKVYFYSETNSLYLRLNDKKTKVNLKIDDGRTDEFTVETENDKLIVYQNYSDRSDANKNENVYFYAFRSRPEVGDEIYLGFDKDPGKDIALAFYLYGGENKEEEFQLFLSGEVQWEYFTDEGYLFSWNDIPVNDNERLIGFLKKRFDIEWAYDAHIEKIENGRTIRIYFKENYLTLELNDDETKAILKIGDFRTDEFIAKKEKDKLNIYECGWNSVEEINDETNHLSKSGKVRINIKGPMVIGDNNLFWLRCSVKDNNYDIPPKINQICLNTVFAVQRSKLKECTYSGSGLPDFSFNVKHVPLLDSRHDDKTPRITVGNDEWTKVEDFDASKSGDNHYTMDLKSGRVTFGDGIHGKIPPEGENNILVCYRTGGGMRGNVKAGAIQKVKDEILETRISVSNHRPASGGEDAETLDEAIQRARTDLKTPYRAVTSQDYERLAINTPGVRVARARALPGYYPGKDSPVPGIVSVIVVPRVEDGTVIPEPSQGLLKTVYEHLDKRRLLTTELFVLRPGYEKITVEATVGIHPRYVGSTVKDEVKKKLNDFLHPTRGGPDGTGWPFGRSVYRSEMYEVIDRVEGVEYVISLAINGTGDDITIPPHSLVYSGNHEVKEPKEAVDD